MTERTTDQLMAALSYSNEQGRRREEGSKAQPLSHVCAELDAILDQLDGHFESEDRDDQYFLEGLQDRLTALRRYIGGTAT